MKHLAILVISGLLFVGALGFFIAACSIMFLPKADEGDEVTQSGAKDGTGTAAGGLYFLGSD